MTEGKTLAAMRSARRRLFELRADGHMDDESLYNCIVQMVEANTEADELACFVDQLRKSANIDLCRKLDRFLLQRIGGFEGDKQELEKALAELKMMLEGFMSPPYFPARYLGTVTNDGTVFAELAHDGGRRVVAFAKEMSPRDLKVGDVVLLCNHQNAVIAKSPTVDQPVGETAPLARRTDDGHLVLTDRDTEVIVSMSDRLASEKLRPGDHILWDRNSHMGLGRVEKSNEHGYKDIDGSTPERLGGLGQLCEKVLARFVYRILHPELAREYRVDGDGARRLLLFGPPGIGKTSLMRIVATTIAQATGQHCRVVSISGAQLHSPFVGVTEQNIRRSFATLNEYDGPGILFIDEVDAIARTRGHASGHHDDRFLGTFLAEMEGMQRSNVAIIAATNRADALDAAFRERFSSEIEMSRPNMKTARQIFEVHMHEEDTYRPNGAEAPRTRDSLIDAGVSRLYDPNSDNRVASLQFQDGKRREVAASELVSGRLIEQVCNTARSSAFERCCRGGESGISVDDMREAAADAVRRLRRTLTTRNVRDYLSDLPQDMSVVSVESIESRVDPARYAR